MKEFLDHVSEYFSLKGWRVTVNVQNVAYILQHSEELLSVQDIHDLLQKKANHKTDLSTVYRVLEKLKKGGLVYEIEGKYIKNNAPEKEGASPHFLLCEKTGKVEEIFLDYNLKAITKQLKKEKGFDLRKMSIYFYGESGEK